MEGVPRGVLAAAVEHPRVHQRAVPLAQRTPDLAREVITAVVLEDSPYLPHGL